MILVADSGSTKTQWSKVTEGNVELLVNTPGINPFLLTQEEIESLIRPISAEFAPSELEAIYFFGAGCAVDKTRKKIASALYNTFECKDIVVDSDLIGACLALAGNTPAVIALLGTGSNSCLWNGSHIQQQTPSLGYILGDEGAGVSLGKQLVSDFLKKQMPLDLRLQFIEKYDVSVEIVLERVYRMQMPNQYLAGFAPFIELNIKHPYCESLLKKQIESFIVRNLLTYDNVKSFPVHFNGSIAYVHRDVVVSLCNGHGLTVAKIVKEPIAGLASFIWNKHQQMK